MGRIKFAGKHDKQKRNKTLKSQFSRFGIPDQFYSDSQSTFVNSDFRNFAKEYRFDCVTSSATFSQSNGLAERAVQTVKNLMKKDKDPYLAMLSYTTTVIDDIGLSPAEMMFSRLLKQHYLRQPHCFNKKDYLKTLRNVSNNERKNKSSIMIEVANR